ncbi:hypothetical protein SUDANB66_06549 (plasmid) [Streptomyces sp. SudanB66_2053]
MQFCTLSTARELREECREKQKRFWVGYGDHELLAGNPPSIGADPLGLDCEIGLRLAPQCSQTNPGQICYSTPFYCGQHIRSLRKDGTETQYDDAYQQSKSSEARQYADESP